MKKKNTANPIASDELNQSDRDSDFCVAFASVRRGNFHSVGQDIDLIPK